MEKILVVDDEARIRDIIRQYVESGRYDAKLGRYHDAAQNPRIF